MTHCTKTLRPLPRLFSSDAFQTFSNLLNEPFREQHKAVENSKISIKFVCSKWIPGLGIPTQHCSIYWGRKSCRDKTIQCGSIFRFIEQVIAVPIRAKAQVKIFMTTAVDSKEQKILFSILIIFLCLRAGREAVEKEGLFYSIWKITHS